MARHKNCIKNKLDKFIRDNHYCYDIIAEKQETKQEKQSKFCY